MEKKNGTNVVVLENENKHIVDSGFDKNAKLYFELKGKIEKLVNDSEFFGWLETFTLYNPNFSDNNFINLSDEVSEYDKYMIGQIKVLYNLINDFLNFIELSTW